MNYENAINTIGLIPSLNKAFSEYYLNLIFLGSKNLVGNLTYSPRIPVEEILLLNFDHPFYKLNIEFLESDIELIESMNNKDCKKEIYIPVTQYKQTFNRDTHTRDTLFFSPTLSFRTFKLNSFEYFKVGYNLKYGGTNRSLMRSEMIHSLYVSDILNSSRYSEELCLVQYESFGVRYKNAPLEGFLKRQSPFPSDGYNSFAIVFIHDLISMSNIIDELVIYLEELVRDVALICETFYSLGLSLEIHGQNLMMKNNKNLEGPKYLYRDNGHVYIINPSKHKNVTDYYALRYEYKVACNESLVESNIYKTIRGFLYGFVGYHADLLVKKRNININVYQTIDKSIRKSFFKKYFS